MIRKQAMKDFVEQGFLHDLIHFDWGKNIIADILNAWKFFHDGFLELVDKHAPIRKYNVKGCNNAWFT